MRAAWSVEPDRANLSGFYRVGLWSVLVFWSGGGSASTPAGDSSKPVAMETACGVRAGECAALGCYVRTSENIIFIHSGSDGVLFNPDVLPLSSSSSLGPPPSPVSRLFLQAGWVLQGDGSVTQHCNQPTRCAATATLLFSEQRQRGSSVVVSAV